MIVDGLWDNEATYPWIDWLDGFQCWVSKCWWWIGFTAEPGAPSIPPNLSMTPMTWALVLLVSIGEWSSKLFLRRGEEFLWWIVLPFSRLLLVQRPILRAKSSTAIAGGEHEWISNGALTILSCQRDVLENINEYSGSSCQAVGVHSLDVVFHLTRPNPKTIGKCSP